MEGSARGPANYGQLDPSVVNGSGPGPMIGVPAGGTPPGPGGGAPGPTGAAPGPAAYSLPQQPVPQQTIQQPVQPPPANFNPMPPGVQELNAPVQSIEQLNYEELQAKYERVRKLVTWQALMLLSIGMAAAFYLYVSIKGKVAPVEVVA